MESVQKATQCKVDGGTRPQITASAKDMWHQAMAAAEIAEKQPPEWNCSIQKVSFPNKKRYPMSASAPRFQARHSGI